MGRQVLIHASGPALWDDGVATDTHAIRIGG